MESDIGIKKGRKIETGAFWKNALHQLFDKETQKMVKKTLNTGKNQKLGKSITNELQKSKKQQTASKLSTRIFG